MENSNLKAKYVYYCDENLDYDDIKKIKNISDLSNHVTEYNYGDLVAFSDYRDTCTCIIGKKGKLISNPDNSGSGYLSIPFSITKYLKDAVSMYGHQDLCVNDIDLRFNDKFILENINTKKCKILKKWNWKIAWCQTELFVKFPNGKSNSFNIKETNSEKILEWFKSSEKEQTKFRVKINLENEDLKKFKEKFGKDNYQWLSASPKIPNTWSEYNGSSGGGSNNHYSITHYQGPIDDKDILINNIKDFYQGFNYQIFE